MIAMKHERPFQLRDADETKVKVVGDRYLVKILELDNLHEVQTDEGLKHIEVPQETVDEKHMGWALGRVIRAGGLSHADQSPNQTSYGKAHRLDTDAWVPMFAKEGDLVIVDRLAGRDLQMRGGMFRIISQTNVLMVLPQDD